MRTLEDSSRLAERPLERPELLVRAPCATDLDAVVRIDRHWSHTERRTFLEERLLRTLRPATINLSRVVERKGEVVGFLFGEVTRGEFGQTGAVAWVDTVGVDPAAVRGGVGSALLSEFMAHARAAGGERVWTLLSPDDEDLTEFLEVHGFRVADTKVVEKVLAPGGAR